MSGNVASNFNKQMYKMSHPCYSDFAAIGRDYLASSGLSQDWINYISGVASKFGTTAQELVGYVNSEYIMGDIVKNDGHYSINEDLDSFLLFVERLDGFSKKIEGLQPTQADMPKESKSLFLWDFPGQGMFDNLKKSNLLGAVGYSMIFRKINSANDERTISDFNDIQLRMFSEGFPLDHHNYVIISTFLDDLVNDYISTGDEEMLLRAFHNQEFERNNQDGLVNILSKIYDQDEINKRYYETLNWLDSTEKFYWNKIVKNNITKEILFDKMNHSFSEKKVKSNIDYYTNIADRIVKSVGSANSWNDYFSSNEFNFDDWNMLVDTLMSKSLFLDNDYDKMQDFKDLLKFNNYVRNGQQRVPDFTGMILASARPCLGLKNCDLIHLSLKSLINQPNVNQSAKASFVGAGGHGKTQNVKTNEHLQDHDKSWLNDGFKSVGITNLFVPVRKEMFYETWDGYDSINDLAVVKNEKGSDVYSTGDSPLNLELACRFNLGMSLPAFGIEVSADRINPNKGFYFRPSALKKSMESWTEYANQKIDLCKTFEDFEKYFGIEESLIKNLAKNKKSKDHVGSIISEAISLPLESISKFLTSVAMNS